MNNISLKNLCCVCLEDGHITVSNNADLPVPKALEALSTKLRSVTQHSVQFNGNYPSMLCKKCITKLNIAYNFIEEFHSSNDKVNKYINQSGISIQTIKTEPIDLEEYYRTLAFSEVRCSSVEDIESTANVDLTDTYSVCNLSNRSPQTVLHMSISAIESTLRSDEANERPNKILQSSSSTPITKLTLHDNAPQQVSSDSEQYVNDTISQTENLVVCLDRNSIKPTNEAVDVKRDIILLSNEQDNTGDCSNNRSVMYDEDEGTIRVEIPFAYNLPKKRTNVTAKQKGITTRNGLIQKKRLRLKKRTSGRKKPNESVARNVSVKPVTSAFYKTSLRNHSVQSKKRKQQLLRSKIEEERILKVLNGH